MCVRRYILPLSAVFLLNKFNEPSLQCGGVTQIGSKNYLNKYYGLSSKSGATVYQKGGAKIAQTVVYVSYNGEAHK